MTDVAPSLSRILYRSRCVIEGSDVSVEADLQRLLHQSRAANARAGLTGALMLTASTFVQTLEGEADVLEATFERICCDLRHADVELLGYARIDERAFGEWSMGRIRADAAVSALFRHVHPAECGAAALAPAASAVTLMETLIRLESLRRSGTTGLGAREGAAVSA